MHLPEAVNSSFFSCLDSIDITKQMLLNLIELSIQFKLKTIQEECAQLIMCSKQKIQQKNVKPKKRSIEGRMANLIPSNDIANKIPFRLFSSCTFPTFLLHLSFYLSFQQCEKNRYFFCQTIKKRKIKLEAKQKKHSSLKITEE